MVVIKDRWVLRKFFFVMKEKVHKMKFINTKGFLCGTGHDLGGEYAAREQEETRLHHVSDEGRVSGHRGS